MKVFCISCNEEIYEFAPGDKYAGCIVEASDFIGLEGSDGPIEGPMYCPKCSKQFYANSGSNGVCLKVGEDSWWPHPPLPTS